ncbi:MAG: cobyrinate a,c-diamide synthase, partial [Sarcina sp.]|nr:cobyrinate a,c-diamide synthase [Sarcina sp.]
MRIPRLMIAAPASGSGKTLITCGLLRLLQEKGLQPAAFKCGPDYIDPMFHRTVLGVPSRNLDIWFLPGKALSRSSYSVQWVLSHAVRRCGAEIALMEGVMGYYDGTGSSGTQASSRELALQTQTPAILVVDAKGMSRSIVPLLQGFVSCEKEERRIRGVILNRISAGMFPLMKKWIEEDTDLQVIGFVPQDRTIVWESRHLGLVRPEETAGIRDQIGYLASIMEKTIDVEALLALAQAAPPFKTSDIETAVTETEPAEAKNGKKETAQTETAQTETAKAFFSPEPVPNVVSFQACKTRPGKSTGPRIAVAMDEAFGFYYEDNFELLRECGADLVFFSPLHDKVFPPADGLILGGGYPELYAQTLAENASMKAQIRAGAAEGMPILAECGGFMYLQEYLEIPEPAEGKKPFPGEAAGRFPMCGILPGVCRMTDHLVRFGYVELENREENPQSPEQSAGPGMRATNTAIGAACSGIAAGTGYLKKGHRIRGHEFHYFDSTENGDACTAYKPGRTRSWGCMVVQGNIMAGFPHLYYRSDPAFAAGFVDRCRQYGDREGTE